MNEFLERKASVTERGSLTLRVNTERGEIYEQQLTGISLVLLQQLVISATDGLAFSPNISPRKDALVRPQILLDEKDGIRLPGSSSGDKWATSEDACAGHKEPSKHSNLKLISSSKQVHFDLQQIEKRLNLLPEIVAALTERAEAVSKMLPASVIPLTDSPSSSTSSLPTVDDTSSEAEGSPSVKKKRRWSAGRNQKPFRRVKNERSQTYTTPASVKNVDHSIVFNLNKYRTILENLPRSQNGVLSILEDLIRALIRRGLAYENIFRVTPSDSEYLDFVSNVLTNPDRHWRAVDISILSTLLLTLLEALPTPPLSSDQFQSIVGLLHPFNHTPSLPKDTLSALWNILLKVPFANRCTLLSVLRLLHLVHSHSTVNNMTADALSRLFYPALFQKLPLALINEVEDDQYQAGCRTLSSLIKNFPGLFYRHASTSNHFALLVDKKIEHVKSINCICACDQEGVVWTADTTGIAVIWHLKSGTKLTQVPTTLESVLKLKVWRTNGRSLMCLCGVRGAQIRDTETGAFIQEVTEDPSFCAADFCGNMLIATLQRVAIYRYLDGIVAQVGTLVIPEGQHLYKCLLVVRDVLWAGSARGKMTFWELSVIPPSTSA